MKKKVLITGVTGTMGFATLKQFAAHLDEFDVRVLARKSDFNENIWHCPRTCHLLCIARKSYGKSGL